MSGSPPQSDAEDCDDPEILALLDFEPVPRRNTRGDGWSPDLQRAFIRHLAAHGSPGKACEALGKRRSGIDKLYKVAGAESFREAWAKAVELAQRRMAARAEAEHAAVARLVPPFVDNRRKGGPSAPPGNGSNRGATLDEEAAEMDEERKLDLLVNIGVKFQMKVAAERHARLSGQIVAADFYLRQVTALEVMIDLMADGQDGAWQLLHELRRGGHGLLHIADTPFSRALDAKRREFWNAIGDPPRPESFREEYLRDHGSHRTQAEHQCYGAMSHPARGYSEAQWRAMSYDEQVQARQDQFDEDSAAQVEWERRASAEWQERQAGGEAQP